MQALLRLSRVYVPPESLFVEHLLYYCNISYLLAFGCNSRNPMKLADLYQCKKTF